jgi:hypothetical protein
MKNKISKFFSSDSSLLILVFSLSFLCYGFLSPWVRFFHDELSMLWFYQNMNDLGRFFEGNRPLLQYLYEPFLRLFGSNSFLWVLFSVIARWLFGLSLYRLINYIWPKMSYLAASISCLAVVYPGFQAQYSSMIFGIAFLIFSLFILSLLFSIKAINRPERRSIYLLMALCFSAVSLFTSEYFFTLEIVRYFLIFVYINNSQKDSRFKKFLLHSGLFLALYLSAIIWRLFRESDETAYSLVLLDNLKASFFPAIVNQSLKSVKDIWYTTIKVWLDSLNPVHLIAQQGRRIVIVYYGLIFVTFIIFVTYFRLSSKNEAQEKDKSGLITLFIFGLVSIIAAGIPFWLAGLPVNEKYFFTRWTIPFIIGSSIIVVSILAMILKNRAFFIVLICILISFGVGTQFLVGNSFRHDSNDQNKLYWELIWRVPALKKNTVLFSDMLNFHYENSDEISSGLNIALANSDDYSSIPYFVFFLPERINTSILPEIREDLKVSGKRYYSAFKGNTSQALIIDFDPPSCLLILDPVLDQNNPELDSLTKQALFLSKPDLISRSSSFEPDRAAIDIIGSEPSKTWCYFFEKADLASQFKEWDVIGELYQQVTEKQYTPRTGREYAPFIEGLSHLSKWDEASKLVSLSLEISPDLKPLLCTLWQRISDDTSASSEKTSTISDMKTILNCSLD